MNIVMTEVIAMRLATAMFGIHHKSYDVVIHFDYFVRMSNRILVKIYIFDLTYFRSFSIILIGA